MRNPNGYGSIVELKGSRRKPYMVRTNATYDKKGRSRYKIVGYCETKQEALELLSKYNIDPWDIDKAGITFAELFKLWKEMKSSKLSEANQKTLFSAFKHCEKIYNRKYREIRAYHMQDCIDNCGKGYATQGHIKNLFYHLDRFALEIDIPTRRYSELLTIEAVPTKSSRRPVSEAEIASLWEISDQPWVDSVLILLYTGFRISEFLKLRTADVDIVQGTIKTDGVKSDNSKNRIVPIHSRILPLVQNRVADGNEYLFGKISYYKYCTKYWEKILPDYVPHEARHTMRSRLDSAGANQKSIDLILGHSSRNVGLRTYTHKTINELKMAVELLK